METIPLALLSCLPGVGPIPSFVESLLSGGVAPWKTPSLKSEKMGLRSENQHMFMGRTEISKTLDEVSVSIPFAQS